MNLIHVINMKHIILLFNVIFVVFCKNYTNDCGEQRNVSITVDDLSSLYRHFVICLGKCHKLKDNERIMVTSQLNSSISVFRELYYHGQISFLIIKKFNDLYKNATEMCSVHPKLLPNWLVIRNKNVSILYDMDVMLTKDEKYVCNELIIISIALDCYGVTQLIPLPSFDVDRNPRHLILPYKKDFVVKINDTYENSIIYKIYFESMKCMNIINTNQIKVHFLNKSFKHWIKNTVIPISMSMPDILPGFGAIYRILSLAEAFEKRIETNNKCVKKSNDKIFSDYYPNMTFGLMDNRFDQNNVQRFAVFKNIHLNKFIFIMLIICVIVLIFVSFYVIKKNWDKVIDSKPTFDLDLNNILFHDELNKMCTNKETNINGSNKCCDNERYIRNCISTHIRARDRLNSTNLSVPTNIDHITMNSERHNALSKSDFRIFIEKRPTTK